MAHTITRRHLMKLAAGTAVTAAAGRALALVDAAPQAASGATRFAAVYPPLDRFIAGYMKEMNSPGMALGMADRSGVVRAAAFGYDNLDSKKPVTTAQLFQIGSISKSFVAITLLQLRDEGKLDLNKPIKDYLPWLPIESDFPAITIHHILTHSSGLQSGVPLPLLDARDRVRPAYAPGEHFHYSNYAFHILGFLISALDQRAFPDAIQARIFDRVGMSQSEPRIYSGNRERQVTSYAPLHDDRPYPRYGPLVQAPWIVSDDAAGSICSTPEDMAKYMAVIANQGKLPHGRLLSAESFALFSTPHIAAEEFGPGASYGYGIAVDHVDGDTILRHTGGMVSFMSAMQVNIDEGVGAFASVNAQQGYRPNPVAAYAIQLMRAANRSQTPSAAPAPNPQFEVKDAADYAGRFTSREGKVLEFAASDKLLFLLHNGTRIQMQRSGGDSFIALHPDFALFPVLFGREKAAATNAAQAQAPKPAVIEVSYGPDWYAAAKSQASPPATLPQQWEQYVGHYHSDSPWEGSFRVLARHNKLFLDGVVELKQIEPALFRVMDEEPSPEWIRFESPVNGKMQLAVFSHAAFRRVEA